MGEQTDKLAIRQNYQLGVLTVKSPSDVISQASAIATELAKIIESKKLAPTIKGKRFVQVEGWSTLGAMLGITPRHDETKTVKYDDGGFEETVELIRVSDGMIIGRASAICGTKDEPIWNKRQTFARKSMAITRATGKAFRLAFSWIMTLAGYEATPYEEIVDYEIINGNQKQSPKQQPNNGKDKNLVGKEIVIGNMLMALADNDKDTAASYLQNITKSDDGKFKGIKSPKDIKSIKQANFIITEIKKQAPQFDWNEFAKTGELVDLPKQSEPLSMDNNGIDNKLEPEPPEDLDLPF